eukprot:767855-Hanusia_phi.AAC.2
MDDAGGCTKNSSFWHNEAFCLTREAVGGSGKSMRVAVTIAQKDRRREHKHNACGQSLSYAQLQKQARARWFSSPACTPWKAGGEGTALSAASLQRISQPLLEQTGSFKNASHGPRPGARGGALNLERRGGVGVFPARACGRRRRIAGSNQAGATKIEIAGPFFVLAGASVVSSSALPDSPAHLGDVDRRLGRRMSAVGSLPLRLPRILNSFSRPISNPVTSS